MDAIRNAISPAFTDLFAPTFANGAAPVEASVRFDESALSDESLGAGSPFAFDASPLLQALGGLDPRQARMMQLQLEIEDLMGMLAQVRSMDQAQGMRQRLQRLQNELAQLQGAGGVASAASASNAGGGSVPSGGGGGGTSAPAAPVAESGGGESAGPIEMDSSEITASGSGAKAVKIAKSKLGEQSSEVEMANYTAAGGLTNNCADFVSAVLDNAGMYDKQPDDPSVAAFRDNLVEQGWKTVSREDAKPGDVAIYNGSQHTELVASKGATTLIGSNNNGTSIQHISTSEGDWGSIEFLHKEMPKKKPEAPRPAAPPASTPPASSGSSEGSPRPASGSRTS